MLAAANPNNALKNYLLMDLSVKLTKQNSKEAEEISEWGSLLDLNYSHACESILQFVSRRYSVSSLAWLERKGNRLEAVFASGNLHSQQMQLSISANDERLLDAVKREVSLELREEKSAKETRAPRMISFFPIAVGGEIPSALIIGDEILSDITKRHISRFCRTIAR